jgi:hypothetical protein
MCVLLLLYIGGLMLPLALPLLAVGHVLAFTLYNSQGYTHHGFQIVSLTLVAQAGTVLYYTILVGLRLRPPDARLNAWLLWQSQMIVVGTYLISVFSKMINSRGLWLWNSSYIAADLIKSRRQLYYGSLDPQYAGDPPRRPGCSRIRGWPASSLALVSSSRPLPFWRLPAGKSASWSESRSF